MILYYYMYRSWQDCCRKGENRSWPSVSVESVNSECWCLNNAFVYTFIMRLTVEECVLRSTFKLNTLYNNHKFSIFVYSTINTWKCSSAGPAVLLVPNSCCLIHNVPVTVQCQAMGVNCADGSILPADSVPVSLCQGPVSAAGILHYGQVQVCPHIHTAGKPRDLTAYLDQCSRQILGSVEMGSHAVHVSTNTNTTWTVLFITVGCTGYFCHQASTTAGYNPAQLVCKLPNRYIKWRWMGILLHTSTVFYVVCMEITQQKPGLN